MFVWLFSFCCCNFWEVFFRVYFCTFWFFLNMPFSLFWILNRVYFLTFLFKLPFSCGGHFGWIHDAGQTMDDRQHMTDKVQWTMDDRQHMTDKAQWTMDDRQHMMDEVQWTTDNLSNNNDYQFLTETLLGSKLSGTSCPDKWHCILGQPCWNAFGLKVGISRQVFARLIKSVKEGKIILTKGK